MKNTHCVVVASVLALVSAACGSKEDTTPACSPTSGSPCVCIDDGETCTSAVECCSGLCDHARGTCGNASPCNPVTGEPCNAQSEFCGENSGRIGDTTTHWDCLSADLPRLALCDECGGNARACPNGTVCVGTPFRCVRVCCDDGDCNGGTCGPFGDAVGVGACFEGFDDPVCDLPSTPPSAGACFTPD